MSITNRIDAITAISPERLNVMPPVPRSVKIEVTARCDFRCFFCATGMRLRKVGDIHQDFYKRIVKEMRQIGVEELGVFYLGESFLLPWLPEAIRYAKEDCGYPYVFLTTNGNLATPDRIRECLHAGLDSLKFSLTYGDPAQFHEVTGVKGEHFYTIVSNIKEARRVRDEVEREKGHRCGIYASSIEYDGEQLERMREVVAEILPYVDQHYWLPLYGQAGLVSDNLGKKGTKPTAGNQGRIGALRRPLPCWSLFTEGHITFDGRMSACCFDHDGRFNMGDLNSMPFLEAWHSKKFQELRRASLNEDVIGTVCENCIVYR